MISAIKILMSVAWVPVLVWAQDIVPPTGAEISALLESIGGLKGAGTLAVVAFVVQAAMLALKSSLGGALGKYRLLAVVALTLIGGVVGLMAGGLHLGAALVHSSSLAAGQVLLHQIFVQFIKKS